MHIDEAFLNDEGRLDTVKLDLVGRMGAAWYTRATPESLFEIPKPISSLGIGVDTLPKHARESNVLTGNNLGRLGNASSTPSISQISMIKASPDVRRILDEFDQDPSQCRDALNGLAQQYLMMDELDKAMAIIFL